MYTQSQVNRILETIKARKKLSPLVYNSIKEDRASIKDFLIQEAIIQDQLQQQGVNISDAVVEEEIGRTAKKLNVSKFGLNKFLNQNGVSFAEYFDMTKSQIQLRYFNANIIAPLIEITDFEIRKLFLQEIPGAKTQNFKYTVVDYVFPNTVTEENKANLPSIIQKSLEKKSIEEKLPKFEKIDFGQITSDEVQREIAEVLEKTDAGSISEGLSLGGKLHFFHVKKKEVGLSTLFEKSKPQIRNYLILQKAPTVTTAWLEKKLKNYYIKKY